MNQIQKLVVSLYLFIFTQFVFAQKKYITEEGVLFNLEVRVVDKSNGSPIKDASVMINGVQFPYLFVKDYFLVKAKVGDQLVVSHPGFNTVYHEITSSEEIRVQIEGFQASYQSNLSLYARKSKSKEEKIDNYFIDIDSANFYKTKDIDKSITFIESILKENYSSARDASAYKLLGDIYFHWKQYDLAITNYKNSLKFREDEHTKLELARAEKEIKNYDEARKVLEKISTRRLGVYYTILVYENLGDVFLATKEYKKATKNYKKGLKIAENRKVTSKITDLNSKLADVDVAQGKFLEANKKFINSLDLAKNQSPVRSIEEKEKVANYYNQTQQFDKEIDLRKETLNEIDSLFDSQKDALSILSKFNSETRDSVNSKNPSRNKISNGFLYDSNINIDSLQKGSGWLNSGELSIDLDKVPKISTPQAINYKIGRALLQKEDFKEAIPYLEKSIDDADKNNDLVVKRDATKKISEAYSNIGDYDKALKAYRDYVALVDSTYVAKEQEMQQAKRFAKKIVDNQNRIASLEKDKELNESIFNLAIKDQELTAARNKNQEYIIYSLIAGILVMIIFAFLMYRNSKQQKLANNLLALKSMRSQMNPHFIFNALNSVNSFIAVNDERNANRYLSEFSVLMRSVLENSDEDFILLSKELELLELYVKLEHNRFKEKFDYEILIDDSLDLDAFSIPPMLLQPYIENAIWHGLRYKEEKGKLEIKVSKIEEDVISVVIQDDGVGRKKSKELKTKNQLKQKSKGMSTIQSRIQILNDMYQDRIDVQVSDLFADETGTKVELILKKG